MKKAKISISKKLLIALGVVVLLLALCAGLSSGTYQTITARRM